MAHHLPIAFLLALIVLCFCAAPASADTAITAGDRAQVHVQAPGCGDGTSWGCLDNAVPAQGCFWNYGASGSGNGFWDCDGWTHEWHVSNDTYCHWYVHVWNNAVHFWHDLCRGRYGSSNLG